MLEVIRKLIWNVALSSVDAPDGGEEFNSGHALQEIARRSGLQCPLYLGTFVRGCEHYNAGVREFGPYRDEGIGTVHAWEPKIHESDVGLMSPVLGDGFFSGGYLRNEQHIPLRRDQRAQSFSNHRMILDAENANGSWGFHAAA